MNAKYILVIAWCMLFTDLFAQTKQKEIRLLDLETATPIVQATFEYGEQHGISDKNGIIEFRFVENATMTISHMSYGSWSLSGSELKTAIKNEVLYRTKESVSLYPVTVIAVKRQSSQPESRLNIEYQDRMEHDGAQILNQLPSFSSIRKGGNYGFDPVFRGFKYDQLNVVLNGAQCATAACPNRMDPPTSQMAPNMIDRIEILKGPYALRYGTGFGATINFVPTELNFTSEESFYGRLSTGYESNGDNVRGESQIGFSGKKHDVNLFSSWSQGNDYTSGNGEIVQADFERGSFGTNMGFKIASNQELRASAIYNRARDADFPALAMDLREDDTWLFNVRHDIEFNGERLKSWNTTIFSSLVNHRMDNLLKHLDPRILNAETHATTYNYGGRTEGVWRRNNGKLYAGADLRIEGAEGIRERAFLKGPNAGNTFEDNAWQEGRISRTGVFTEYQLNGSVFDYIFSGRLELNNADISDISDEFTQIYSDTKTTHINPSLSIGILKEFGTKLETSLWLGRVQRSGGLTERFINFFPIGQDPFEMLGNPKLDPEINNQIDLTFKWRPSHHTIINVNLFGSYLQDYISSVIDPTLEPRLPMSPGVRQFINIQEVFKAGFEINWSQKLFMGLQQQWGIAYTYGQDLERDEPLPEIAPLDVRYTLTGSYFKSRLSPELVFRFVAEQSRTSSEFGETVTPSFALLDINIGYQISDKLSLNAGVNNLFDKNYYEHLNRSVRGGNNPIFALGRNVLTNLNFTF